MSLDPATDIGHVHLKVADLDRAIAFYRDVLGFELTTRLGRQAAFLSAGGYHHHIGLNTWESAGGSPPPSGHDRALSPRRPLPHEKGACRDPAGPDRSTLPDRGGVGPRRE